jgi:hypothetical protein
MHEIRRFLIKGRRFQYITVFSVYRATWQNRKPEREAKNSIKMYR